MPVRDRQRLITDILATLLKEPPGNPSFGWMTNKQGEEDSGEPYASLRAIFKALRGNAEAQALKRERPLNCDAYFGGSYNFIFEFDEVQHFSSFRLKTFDHYPQSLRLGYNLARYKDYCKRHMVEANSYREAKITDDFPFAGGRTAQRAYFDAVRDLLPPVHGLNPTLRIAEFEVTRVVANDKVGQGIIRDILRNRLPTILPQSALEENELMSDNTQYNKLREIDDYIQGLFPRDDALLQALDNSERNELPPINVSPNEGRLLYMLARLCGARRILEIGTLGGFSTINLARALPNDGRLISLEYSPKHAEVARANIEIAGLSDKVEVRVGAGLDLLPQIEANGEGPFDLFFIDADKDNYPGYLDWCLRLSRPGSVILSDNLIRDGAVIDPPADNVFAQVIHHYNRTLSSSAQLETVILPIVRESVDGLGISVVK